MLNQNKIKDAFRQRLFGFQNKMSVQPFCSYGQSDSQKSSWDENGFVIIETVSKIMVILINRFLLFDPNNYLFLFTKCHITPLPTTSNNLNNSAPSLPSKQKMLSEDPESNHKLLHQD